jgi:hypothetical protein
MFEKGVTQQKVVLNQSLWNNQKKVISTLRKRIEDNEFVKVKENKVQNYTVCHETGHVLHNALFRKYASENNLEENNTNRNSFIARELDRIYNNYATVTGVPFSEVENHLPSRYARKTNPDTGERILGETYAEIFVLGQYGLDNDPWKIAMNQYLKELS